MSFVLNPDGTVKSAQADQSKSQIHAADVETCAVAALKGAEVSAEPQGNEIDGELSVRLQSQGPAAQDRLAFAVALILGRG